MTGYRNERAVSIVPFVIFTSMFPDSLSRIRAHAMNPDIPRIEAGAEEAHFSSRSNSEPHISRVAV